MEKLEVGMLVMFDPAKGGCKGVNLGERHDFEHGKVYRIDEMYHDCCSVLSGISVNLGPRRFIRAGGQVETQQFKDGDYICIDGLDSPRIRHIFNVKRDSSQLYWDEAPLDSKIVNDEGHQYPIAKCFHTPKERLVAAGIKTDGTITQYQIY
jgi:hypothetical protein